MHTCLLCLTLILSGQSAASPQSSAQDQLSPNELRLLLSQLYELQAARAKIVTYEEFIAREKEQDQKELELASRRLQVEKDATKNAEAATALATEKATLYKQLLEAATKKPGGIGCFFKRLFTIGIARCGG